MKKLKYIAIIIITLFLTIPSVKAANISTTECCFTNATDMHTKAQNTTINVLHPLDADFSLSHVDAIPIEIAT
jgi:hypothetical protein